MLTIQELITKIQAELPEAMPADTVDTFKSGNASQPVKGIVTTFIANWNVIQQAARLGANLIITHEPTYFNHRDETDWLKNDPVYQAKRKLIDDNGLVVWRFHDGWHMHRPDGIMTGLIAQLGWEAYQDPETPFLFHLPPSSLKKLAEDVKAKIGVSNLRVVGAPEMICSTAAICPGSYWGEMQIEMLGKHGADVLLAGEVPEWQTPEYVRDATAAGIPKGLVIMGHEPSEEGGMGYLVDWLKARYPSMAVKHVPAGQPLQVI